MIFYNFETLENTDMFVILILAGFISKQRG